MKKIYFFNAVFVLLSFSVLADQSYSLNLMWINKAINPENKYIFPEVERNGKQIITQVRQWAELNPDVKLHFWYDSNFTTPEQIHNTEAIINMLEEYNKSINRRNAKIVLKDLREFFNTFTGNKLIFSSGIPLYFRLDLLRLMVSLDEVRHCQQSCYSFYSDVDVTPTNLESLMTEATKVNLSEIGLAFKSDIGGHFENSFHVLSNQQPLMLKALEEAGIKSAINVATTFLAKKDQGARMPEGQVIYWLQLPAVYLYFYHLMGKMGLSLNGEILSKNEDNSNKFTPDPIDQGWVSYFRKFAVNTPSAGEMMNGHAYLIHNIFRHIPTVPVEAPAIKYKYDD